MLMDAFMSRFVFYYLSPFLLFSHTSSSSFHTFLFDYQFTRTEKVLSEVRTESERVSREYELLVEEVGHKADFKAIDSIVFENADEIEKIIRNYDTKAQHESKIQAAYMADMRTQLEDMQKYQNTVDAKLQTALRFIDWFMSVIHQLSSRHTREN